MARLGFIGTGEIASAMIKALTGQGHEILVSPRNAQRAASLSQRFVEVNTAPNDEIAEKSDIVFLCLMADKAREILPKLAFRSDQIVISAMVDVPMDALRSLCAPARDFTICIPLPSIAAGQSALPVFPASKVLSDLFGSNNLVIPCHDEAALNAHFAASALASPILDQMREGAAWLAALTGDAKSAESYVATIFAGFLRDHLQDPEIEFTTLLESLATEGGLNASLRAHMRETGALDELRAGLDALRPRLGLGQ